MTDFSHVPMFLHPATSRLHKAIVSKLVQSGTPPFIRIKTSLTSSLVSLCAQGHGIFSVLLMLLKHLYETQTKCFESLNVFPVTEFQGTRKTLLLYHKNKYLNRPLLSSIDIIKQVYKEHRYVNGQTSQQRNTSGLNSSHIDCVLPHTLPLSNKRCFDLE